MSKTAKKYLLAGTLTLIFLAVGFATLRAATFSFWERGLLGPYEGKSHSGKITSLPTSSLTLESIGTLELHQDETQSHPILALRRDGQIQWARLVEPAREQNNGQIEAAHIRDAQLIRPVRPSSGIRIFFTCDWEWGGKEGGLIYLTKEGDFERFGISW